MNGTQDLIVKNVDMFGDTIMAAKDKEGHIWAGVSYFCKALGMSNKQRDAQVEKVQTDKTLKRGTRKFPGGVFDPNNEVIAIKIDFIPLWLAKISITDKMEKEHPELADKLLQYQLKAKDVLANAFLAQTERESFGESHYIKSDIPVGEVASLSKVMDRIMVRQESKPYEIAEAFELLCGQFGIILPENFVKIPEYEQCSMVLGKDNEVVIAK